MCCDQDDWNFRLVLANVRNYLKTGDVRQEEIDDAETKRSLSHLINSSETARNKDHLVAVRLKHKPERVAYRGLVIYDEDAQFILHWGISQHRQGFAAIDEAGRSTFIPSFFSFL